MVILKKLKNYKQTYYSLFIVPRSFFKKNSKIQMFDQDRLSNQTHVVYKICHVVFI